MTVVLLLCGVVLLGFVAAWGVRQDENRRWERHWRLFKGSPEYQRLFEAMKQAMVAIGTSMQPVLQQLAESTKAVSDQVDALRFALYRRTNGDDR